MYTRQAANDGGYGGLGKMWFAGVDPAKVIKNPKQIRDSEAVWGSPAIRYVEEITNVDKQAAKQLAKKRATPKKLWWSPRGPYYGFRPRKATRSEPVPKPEKKFVPAVQIVRDMPRLDLDPITMPPGAAQAASQAIAKLEAETASGFGDTSLTSKLPYIVLGLLLIRFLYNK